MYKALLCAFDWRSSGAVVEAQAHCSHTATHRLRQRHYRGRDQRRVLSDRPGSCPEPAAEHAHSTRRRIRCDRAGCRLNPLVVYMDDVRQFGDLVVIPSRVKEIRFLNSRDATTRYGTGHSSGVILVTTKR
jgi:hypothetical protein